MPDESVGRHDVWCEAVVLDEHVVASLLDVCVDVVYWSVDALVLCGVAGLLEDDVSVPCVSLVEHGQAAETGAEVSPAGRDLWDRVPLDIEVVAVIVVLVLVVLVVEIVALHLVVVVVGGVSGVVVVVFAIADTDGSGGRHD